MYRQIKVSVRQKESFAQSKGLEHVIARMYLMCNPRWSNPDAVPETGDNKNGMWSSSANHLTLKSQNLVAKLGDELVIMQNYAEDRV